MNCQLLVVEQPKPRERTSHQIGGEEFVRLRGKRAKLQAKLNKISAKLAQCRSAIEDHCREELDEIDKTNSELLALDRREEDNLFSEAHEEAMNKARVREYREKVFGKSERKHSDESKRMYRRIASRWGPDRANTDREREAFLEAKQAYNNDDLQALRKVYKQCLNPLSLDDQLKSEERSKLTADINYLKRQIAHLSNSDDSRVMRRMKAKKTELLAEAKVAVRKALEGIRIELACRKTAARRRQDTRFC